MTKRIARRYADGSFNVSTASEDLDRARQLLNESGDDDDTELVEVDIIITRSFGRPKLEVVPPDAKEAVVHAARRFSDCAAEFDGDLSACGEHIDALWTAVDRLKKVEET